MKMIVVAAIVLFMSVSSARALPFAGPPVFTAAPATTCAIGAGGSFVGGGLALAPSAVGYEAVGPISYTPGAGALFAPCTITFTAERLFAPHDVRLAQNTSVFEVIFNVPAMGTVENFFQRVDDTAEALASAAVANDNNLGAGWGAGAGQLAMGFDMSGLFDHGPIVPDALRLDFIINLTPPAAGSLAPFVFAFPATAIHKDVPEPSGILLFSIALIGLGFFMSQHRFGA